jgi:hypothetical protein
MVSKYLLISVKETNINVMEFTTLSAAQDAMNSAFYDASRGEEPDQENSFMDTKHAYVLDGKNHDNYSWKIYPIKEHKFSYY